MLCYLWVRQQCYGGHAQLISTAVIHAHAAWVKIYNCTVYITLLHVHMLHMLGQHQHTYIMSWSFTVSPWCMHFKSNSLQSYCSLHAPVPYIWPQSIASNAYKLYSILNLVKFPTVHNITLILSSSCEFSLTPSQFVQVYGVGMVQGVSNSQYIGYIRVKRIMSSVKPHQQNI